MTHAPRRTVRIKSLLGGLLLSSLTLSLAQAADPEKEEIKLGFIKLTDMAPLAIAYEKGYFEEEGLYVTLEAQANWKVLLDRVISGELDGAHMLPGQPLGATIGFGTKADVVTAYSMDLNGNGITMSNAVWDEMKKHVPMENGKPVHPIKADALKPVIEQYKAQGKPFAWRLEREDVNARHRVRHGQRVEKVGDGLAYESPSHAFTAGASASMRSGR